MVSRKLKMAAERERLPSWFRTRLPSGELQKQFNETKSAVKETTADKEKFTLDEESN